MVRVVAEEAESNLPEDCAVIAGSAGAESRQPCSGRRRTGKRYEAIIEAASRVQARRENDFMAETSPELFG